VKGYFEEANAARLREIPESTRKSDMEAIPLAIDERTGKMGVRLQRCTLPDYATDDFWEAVEMWRDWKTFGFPEPGGMNDQGSLWRLVIKVMERCGSELKVE
jgi:hypothetical protein